MAYRVNHYNKKTGTTYVYEAESFWDKEKKRPANKQICVGKLDKITGEFIPSKRLDDKQAAVRDPKVTANVQTIGSFIILDKITKDIEIDQVLKKCAPETFVQLLTMAYFLVSKGEALSHCESWCKAHVNPYNGVLTTQRISELLKKQTEDERQSFFSKWYEKMSEKDYLCYDITSISSYSDLNEYVKSGYNRDNDRLPQVNFGMLFGQNTRLPICYKRMPGSISDVSTLKNFIKTLDYLNPSRIHLVMDRGFYSKSNIDELLGYKHKFTMGVPIKRRWVETIIDEFYEEIEMPDNHRKIDGDTLYVKTRLYPWGVQRKRTYVHVYYNSYAASSAFDKFTEELLMYKEELESKKLVKKHEEYYQQYFIIKETPIRGRKIQYNNAAIQKHRNRYSGFFVILSNATKDAVEALEIYRNKDVVEKSFDDLKNRLDMKRLRVQNSQTMDGRLFVQFLALIIISAIRNIIRSKKELENYTVRELIKEMDTLTKITYTGKYGSIISEVTKKQRIIMKAFSIEL